MEDDDLESAREKLDLNDYIPDKVPHNNRRKLLVLSVILLVGAAVAGGAYWWLKGQQKPARQTAANVQAKPPETKLAAEEASAPKTFKSSKLKLEFTHRKDWTVREEQDGGELIVSSPGIGYERKSGTVDADTGVFTLKFRTGVTEGMTKTLEASTAVKASEIIAYTAPTPSQRHYTNISYAGQDNFFTFFMVTGATQYKVGDIISGGLILDNQTFVIAGGYGSSEESEFLSYDPVPKDKMDQSPAFKQAIEIVKSLKVF